MARNRSGIDDPSRRGRARRGSHGAPKGIYDLRLEIPPADQLGKYRQVFSGPHWGWSVVDADPNTRIATHPAQDDDIGSLPCEKGVGAIALSERKLFDGLWVRQNTGASTARLWVFEEPRLVLQGIAVSLNRAPRQAGAPLVKTGIGTSSVEIVPANANRQGVYLRNKSLLAQVIDLGFNGNPAVAGQGVNFLPEEEKSWDVEDGLGPGTGAIVGISSAAAGIMQFQEF